MYDLDQISSTLGDFINAVFHPSVANLPAGFLVLVFAVLIIAALPEGAREKMRLASLAAVGLIVSLSLTWPVTSAILRYYGAAAFGRPPFIGHCRIALLNSVAEPAARPQGRRNERPVAEGWRRSWARAPASRSNWSSARPYPHKPNMEDRCRKQRHLLSGDGADRADEGNRRPGEAHGYDSSIVRAVPLARTLWLNWAHKRAG